MTTITAPAGFFLNDAVSPSTATDLITAVASAQANVNSALASETAAASSATAAASSAAAAAGSANSASSSATAASNSASAASGSASTATTQATNAASSATAASTSAGNAATSATNASTAATNASGSVTAAANSASAAATSATNAANSAAAASASQSAVAAAVGTIPTPGVGNKLAMIRVNAAGNAYEAQTPAQVATDIGALNDVGRNKLHNAQFAITQRGGGPFTTLNTYTVDRWLLAGTTDTVSVTQVALSDADRTAIGDEEAGLCLQNVFTGNAGASAFNTLIQRIERVRRLAGKTVTVSFWAKANSGTPKLGISCDQSFGTGGSPSADVTGTGTAVTISTTWTRYQVAVAIPSVSGKTLGTNGDDYTGVNVWFSSGSANASHAGSIGVQSGTIKLWGVQLEVGSIMTPLEKPDPQQDLANCQRFFQALASVQVAAFANAVGTFTGAAILYPVAMRATPTAVTSNFSFANANAGAVNPVTPFIALTTVTATAAAQCWALFDLTLSADL